MKLIWLLNLFILLPTALYAEGFTTVLYVGDSHSYGKLGQVIEKNLATKASRVVMHASCGATPSTWLGNNSYQKTVCGYWKKDGAFEIRQKEHNTPKFIDELNDVRPEITIVQLGTNIAAQTKPQNSKNSIIAMMTAIKSIGSKCIWIGPPDANSKIVTKEKLIETNLLLQNLANENDCYYIDSLVLTQFPLDNKEGIHYPPSLSAEWGNKVNLEVPLRLFEADLH